MAVQTVWGVTLQEGEYELYDELEDGEPVPHMSVLYAGLRRIATDGDPTMVDPWLKPRFESLPATTPDTEVVLAVGMTGMTVT